ncbi:MAG: flippase [bacterium]
MSNLSISFIKEKWMHAGFQKYLKNTGWMFFGRIFTLTISFFIGIYIARYLGPSNYGLLNYIMSFVGLFSFLASFGMDGIINREIIKNHSKKDEIIGTGFYLKIIGSLLAIFLIFIVSIFTTRDIFTLGLIWIFSLSFIPQAFNVIEIYFQSQVLSKNAVKAQTISSISSALLKIICIVFNRGIFWLTLVFLVEALIYGLILLISFRHFGNHIRKWKFNKTVAISLLKDSWPLMLSSVAVGVYMKIDQVMIKNILGNEQAGIYAVAMKLSEVWYFIPGIISVSLFPSIMNAMSTSKLMFEDRLKKLYLLLFWLSVSVAAFITIFAHPIIKILFGEPYLGAVSVLQVYVWAGVGVSIGFVVNQYLLAVNLTKVSFYITLMGAIVNIIMNIILIPKIGIIGAAIATLVAYNIAAFGIIFFKKTRKAGLLILRSIVNL